jgi:threonine/homoserine/homoserine lactone efflux protein
MLTHDLLPFLATGLALNLTPGPDMLYVAARGANEGRRAGVASALGIGAGTLVHISLVAFGLAGLLAAVPAAYAAVRIAGGSYLIWLGVSAFRRGPGARDAAIRPASHASAFRQGIITNVLNPKVALFFLAFLPQFIDPAAGHPARQVVLLGLLFDLSGTSVNLLIAMIASRAAGGLRVNAGVQQWLQRGCGLLFIGLGVRLAVVSRR